MGDNVWDSAGTDCHSLDLEKLIGSLFGGDTMDDEAALDIVQDAEMLPRLLNGNNI